MNTLKLATFGSGCFWCTEAIFQRLRGVEKVVSGYSGGHLPDPTYRQVCEGTTGHAEVCQVHYDPTKISYEELLEVFWETHDPTTHNRQGNDIGEQYRSVIFYHDEDQKTLADNLKSKLNASGIFKKPIITEISKYTDFFPAEDYHQEYILHHPDNPYVQNVSIPDFERFRKEFKGNFKS